MGKNWVKLANGILLEFPENLRLDSRIRSLLETDARVAAPLLEAYRGFVVEQGGILPQKRFLAEVKKGFVTIVEDLS